MAVIRRIEPNEMAQLLDAFKQQVLPWCENNEFSLHEAFKRSRDADPEKHTILSRLWHTKQGRAYLSSVFQSKDGRLHR